jgi:hypothetical protein
MPGSIEAALVRGGPGRAVRGPENENAQRFSEGLEQGWPTVGNHPVEEGSLPGGAGGPIRRLIGRRSDLEGTCFASRKLELLVRGLGDLPTETGDKRLASQTLEAVSQPF